jgi:hypothetical protein
MDINPFPGPRTAAAIFTSEELWLLQSVVRHETAQQEQWRNPPASLDLNQQIAESILRCDELALGEAPLVLSYEDCLVIDYCVPQTAKSPSGAPIGKSVLLKSYRARKAIEDGGLQEAEEPPTPTSAEVQERLRNKQGG